MVIPHRVAREARTEEQPTEEILDDRGAGAAVVATVLNALSNAVASGQCLDARTITNQALAVRYLVAERPAALRQALLQLESNAELGQAGLIATRVLQLAAEGTEFLTTPD